MEIYDQQSKQIVNFSGEESYSQIISAKEGSHDYKFGFCLKIVLKLQWPRVLISSILFVLVLTAFDFIFYYSSTNTNTFKYLMIFDACILVVDIIANFLIFAFRMKENVKRLPITFVEVYQDYIQMKELNQDGKVVFKLPYKAFTKTMIFKDGYVLIFKGPNNMNASIILSKQSIQESGQSDFENILTEINNNSKNNTNPNNN